MAAEIDLAKFCCVRAHWPLPLVEGYPVVLPDKLASFHISRIFVRHRCGLGDSVHPLKAADGCL